MKCFKWRFWMNLWKRREIRCLIHNTLDLIKRKGEVCQLFIVSQLDVSTGTALVAALKQDFPAFPDGGEAFAQVVDVPLSLPVTSISRERAPEDAAQLWDWDYSHPLGMRTIYLHSIHSFQVQKYSPCSRSSVIFSWHYCILWISLLICLLCGNGTK